MKHLIILLILVSGIFVQGNAQKNPRKGSKSINFSQADQQNSALFKSLKGQDRITVFKQLQSLIRVKAVAADGISPTSNWAQVNTEGKLVALLGQPDVQIQKTLVQYILSADGNTKLVVGFNKNREIEFFTIK
jgi:hypothetical protein